MRINGVIDIYFNCHFLLSNEDLKTPILINTSENNLSLTFDKKYILASQTIYNLTTKNELNRFNKEK